MLFLSRIAISTSVVLMSLTMASANLFGGSPENTGTPVASPRQSPEDILRIVSYGIGHNISSNFKKQNIVLDDTAFNLGMQDGAHGQKPTYDEATVKAAMETFQVLLNEQHKAQQATLAASNKVQAQQFLTENAQRPGVTTTASGLQYRVINRGTGTRKTILSDTVIVHYSGRLLDGLEFDSSYTRNEPATFNVGSLIAGWAEGLQLMAEGDKFELALPAELAYGEVGAGKHIGPNAALLFEVELLKIK